MLFLPEISRKCVGRYLLFLGLLVVVYGCSSDHLDKLTANSVILAFGDSLTTGKGVSSEHSYPSILSHRSKLRVLNKGISGETTQEGLTRFKSVLNESSPDLLILMHGGNDILRGIKTVITKSNLEKMIRIALESDVEVVLVGIPEKKLFSSVAPFYQELADEYNLVLEDSIIASLLKKPGMKSDTVHFNKAGYEAIAIELEKLLKKNGAL